jgi:hypothetical protein
MSRRLSMFMLATDMLFLAYWSLSLLAQLGLMAPPAGLMYAGYDQPRVIAWNWSFMPTDILFSVSGIVAVLLARRSSRLWHPVAIMSLCFTMIAGLMAISYWTLLREFDPVWYLPNLALVVWPLFFLPGLVRQSAAIGDGP